MIMNAEQASAVCVVLYFWEILCDSDTILHVHVHDHNRESFKDGVGGGEGGGEGECLLMSFIVVYIRELRCA